MGIAIFNLWSILKLPVLTPYLYSDVVIPKSESRSSSTTTARSLDDEDDDYDIEDDEEDDDVMDIDDKDTINLNEVII